MSENAEDGRESLHDLHSLLKSRQTLTDPQNLSKWELGLSEISGRGVFASRDLAPGELIFQEIPLVTGPRSVAAQPVACVVCQRLDSALSPCCSGCRLPVCSPLCSSDHCRLPECSFLRGRQLQQQQEGMRKDALAEEEVWSPLLYRALTPLRCLFLQPQDTHILQLLAQNKNNKHLEILLLENELDEGSLSPDELSQLQLACRVLNGVAFEVELAVTRPLESVEMSVSWRSLSPLAGCLNHSCSPNTAHSGGPQRLEMRTVRRVAGGEELTTSYCPLLWSTLARRHFLRITKEFDCLCPRCSDPTEFESYFSAGWCECGGRLLPCRPLEPDSPWSCNACPRPPISLRQHLLREAATLGTSSSRAPLPSALHYIAAKRNCQLIWSLGHGKKPYSDVTDEDLETKLRAIHEVMDVNNALQLGESKLKESLEAELHATMNEITKRKSLGSK